MVSLRLAGLFLLFSSFACSQVVFYPPLAGRPASSFFRVFVDGQEVFVEEFRTAMNPEKLPAWFVSEPYTAVQQEVHFASFACAEPVTVRLLAPQPIAKASVRPRSRNVIPRIDGRAVEFTLSGPEKLYIEINDLPALLLFADPPEGEVPSPDDPNVHWFGPGLHKAGLMTLKDGETLYLAPGALVYGGVRAHGAQGIRILGRGILDGGFHERNMVRLSDCRNVRVEGVTIRNGVSWTNTLINCEDVVYHGVKVISFGPSGDGVNPVNSRRVTIERCFFRCTDDCIAIKTPNDDQPSENIQVLDNTMIGFAFSDGVTIGFETNAPIRNVTVRNCDILQARGGSRVGGHSAFSIICDGPALIENVLFENLRVAADVLKAFELHVTNGKAYGDDLPGNIRNVHLKNIFWEAARPIILAGFDDSHRVQNVLFEDCFVAGEPLSADYASLQIRPFVDELKFLITDQSK